MGWRVKRFVESQRAPADASSLAVLRILFGLLMFASTLRFLTSGWIEKFYQGKAFFFKYWGFSFIEVPSVGWIYAIYIGLALCSLLIAIGLFYRVAAVLFAVGFTVVELFDATNYLNHYYLVSLLGLLFVIVPTHRCFSIDAMRRPLLAAQTLPRWCLYLFRFQIACVYIFAGLAKFQSDWLLHAQPLNLWLTARTDTAIIGPLLDHAWVAYVASWAGFLFDTTIVFWLSMRRTRRVAYLVLLGFHFFTGVFFNIGMFPYIMTVAATVFFAPDWPRRWLRRSAVSTASALAPASGLRKLGLAAIACFCLLQVIVPLRRLALSDNVLWDEQGMRWSWQVMVREKHGAVTYFVGAAGSDGELQVSPHRYLDRRQEREMSAQPDLILQLAHHIRDDFEARGYREVTVRAEALVSLNGRAKGHMIDSSVNLAAIENGLWSAEWILPAPSEAPPRIGQGR